MLAKEVSFSASTLGIVEEINVRDLSGNTLSENSSTQVILVHLECHIVIPAKSQIDLSKSNTGTQLREMNSSATKREYV